MVAKPERRKRTQPDPTGTTSHSRDLPVPSDPLDPTGDLASFRASPMDAGLLLERSNATMLPSEDAGEVPYGLDSGSEITDSDASLTAKGAVTPRSILEAILFVGHPTSEGISSRFIAALMRGVRPAEIEALVVELNEEYDRLGCPYQIASLATGYRLVLREEYVALREAFYGKVREARLSQAAIDALAVVAYHQPIDRDEIGRYSDTTTPALLAQLVRRGLLNVERPAGVGQRGWQYGTTDRFLQMFGLKSLEDLPRAQGLDQPPV